MNSSEDVSFYTELWRDRHSTWLWQCDNMCPWCDTLCEKKLSASQHRFATWGYSTEMEIPTYRDVDVIADEEEFAGKEETIIGNISFDWGSDRCRRGRGRNHSGCHTGEETANNGRSTGRDIFFTIINGMRVILTFLFAFQQSNLQILLIILKKLIYYFFEMHLVGA